MDRTVLHCDMNNFYASVEMLLHPELRGKPVAVAGDPQARHGIVLAKSYEAKRRGVKTGNALWMARQLCPDIIFVPPHFDEYLKFSRLAQEIYMDYTDQVESFGLDECWLDVTGSTDLFGDGKDIADVIRERIKRELGVTVSVGVSYNKIFAKLGSDLRKPDATTVISKEDYREIVWPLPVSDLLYVGPATTEKLRRYLIKTIGDLAKADWGLLQSLFGKVGTILKAFANGWDISPVASCDAQPQVKSIGNSTTTPKDLLTDRDIKITLYVLCESVAERLREQYLVCSTVQVWIRYDDLRSCERQASLDGYVCNSESLFKRAYELVQRNRKPDKPLRSLGVRACNLAPDIALQTSFFPEVKRAQRGNDLEKTVDTIRRRFGHHSIQRGIAMMDRDLSVLDPKNDHVIHPVGFLR